VLTPGTCLVARISAFITPQTFTGNNPQAVTLFSTPNLSYCLQYKVCLMSSTQNMKYVCCITVIYVIHTL